MLVPCKPEYSFNVKVDGGAKYDGSDDSDAIDETIAKAVDYITTNGVGAEVYFPPGAFSHARPLWHNHPKLRLRGAGRFLTQATFQNVATGLNLIGGPDRSSGPGAPQYTSALGGTALVCAFTNSGADNFFDLTTYHQFRLTGSWSFNYTATNIERIPTAGEFALFLPGVVMGQLYQKQPYDARCLGLFVDYLGRIHLQFRYGNYLNDWLVATDSKSAVAAGDTVNLDVSWDDSAKILRVFLNGQLWTLGALTPAAHDGTGFTHHPWERFCLGSGYPLDFPNDSIGIASLPCALRSFHASKVVRHTSAFTPDYSGGAPDANTLIQLDFSRRSPQGMVIAKGNGGTQDVYLYPICMATNELPQLELLDMGFIAGFGPRYEFAPNMTAARLMHLNPGDGWQFMRNGYKSTFRDIEIVGGLGRTGITFHQTTDSVVSGVHAAGPICYAMISTNLHLDSCLATIQNIYSAGFLMKGMGTNKVSGGGVDAESTAPDFIAAAILEDPQAYTFMGAKLYSPPGSAASPILYPAPAVANPSAQVNLIGCLLDAALTTPLIKTGGPHVHPVKVIGCSNSSGSDVCDVPANVVLL